jgi:hypothetical protein
MDYDARQLERELARHQDVNILLRHMREQQRSGRNDYVINFQTLTDAPVDCPYLEENNPNLCSFMSEHQDVGLPLQLFSYIFRQINNPETAQVHMGFDITPYTVGADLLQSVETWAQQMDTSVMGPDLETLVTQPTSLPDPDIYNWDERGIRPEDLVQIEFISGDELYSEMRIAEAFVVDRATNQLINDVLMGAVSHYLAPNYFYDYLDHYRQRHPGEGWGTQGAAVYRNLQLVLNGALVSRLVMYRRMALLRITNYGIEIANP